MCHFTKQKLYIEDSQHLYLHGDSGIYTTARLPIRNEGSTEIVTLIMGKTEAKSAVSWLLLSLENRFIYQILEKFMFYSC